MAPRSSWKGYLKVSLVAIPVKAYNATSESNSIQLNQLHEECHSRIRYQKTCPIHGEVSQDEIVSGYEYSKGQYVVVDPSEIQQLRPEGDKSIAIDKFIPAETLDRIYDSGRTYYLIPDGPVGQKPYALLRDAMVAENCQAIAQVVISNREQLVRLRPYDNLLTMTVLNHAAQVKLPTAFSDELVSTDSTEKEVELTRQLIQALSADSMEMSEYRDVYTEKLTKLIESKVSGQELVTSPVAAEPQVINLMDALKASVEQATRSQPAKAAKESKPARKMAQTPRKTAAAKKKPAEKKRKSS
ncbi:MAG: Ku protein [Planctomycetales bacterium]|nr:Ku protein [Planctomycetales bacterium]MCA9169514.1 Ku protein [Planctomycetales bacterium]